MYYNTNTIIPPRPASRLGHALGVIDLRGVRVAFGAHVALDGVSLTFAARRTTVLVGPSGCGKSSLVRAVLGLVPLDAGTIRVEGIDLAGLDELGWRRRAGYVIQDGGLFPHLTCRANVEVVPRHLGWSEERRAARLGELAALVRLAPSVLERHPRELSGGQRQRVGLMRALALDPDVLLLDEPLGALDPLVRRELQEDLRSVFRQLDKTVVLVTHDLGEAAFFADTIVLLRAGRVVQCGALEDLAQRPADEFVARFVRAQRSPLESLGGTAP